MLTKFETKSNRVKGLSFHPKRYHRVLNSEAGSPLAGTPADNLISLAGNGSWPRCTAVSYRYAASHLVLASSLGACRID